MATLFDKILPACGYVETSDLMEPRMGLLAGSPTEKGSWTGPGPAARFSDLNRLAFTGAHPDPRMAGKWLVLDSIGNRIRLMAADGTVEPWLGDAKSGKGYEDGPAAQARFGTLGSISVRPEGPDAGPWRAVIADSGNHVLREVDAHGNVTTLAGMPGQAGYADGAATESQFEAPWDAVYGLDGAVYGIDPVNHSIRKILGGQVTTLAGSRQNRSIQDGTGQEAGFGQPLAIALDPSTSHLYVSDASCIRRVTKDGVVTTLAGGSQPGFEDWMTGPALPEAADRMRGLPCFQAIAGLTVHMGKLYIADSLNHAVRVLDLETGALTTLAGHPDQDRVRPGRLRAGRALDPDRCAALAEPQHVAFDRHGRCLVALSPTHPKAGACIAELSLAGILMADPSPAVAGETKASPFNENLLMHHLLGTDAPDSFKLYVLDSYLEQLRGTLYRQGLFAEFERALHEQGEQGLSLTPDWLDRTYLELTRAYYGHDQGVVRVGDWIRCQWSVIPHFYMNFYVFQYATSMAASMALARAVLEEGEPARERYLRLLRSAAPAHPGASSWGRRAGYS